MNKQLTHLLNGYQDLADRYGSDDPLVRQMLEEIEHRQVQLGQPPPLLSRPATVRFSEWRNQRAAPHA